MANSSILNQLQNSGWGGEWDAGGVDRYAELASLLHQNGVTSLEGLSWGNSAIYNPERGGWFERDPADGRLWELRGEGRDREYSPDYLPDGPEVRQLMIGDRAIGYMGDIGRGGDYEGKGMQYSLQPDLVGWSSQGHGNVGYKIYTDAHGNPAGISPNWASSSDAGTARDVLKGAAVVGGAALGMNAAFGGLGGVGSSVGAAPSLAGRVTTPALLESAAGTAGYGASSAGGGGFTGFGGALSAAGKGAATNAGITKLSGGSWNDALKAGAIGGLSAGLGSYVGDNYGQFLGGATRGAVSSGLQGGSLSDIAKSGLVSGLGSRMPNLAGYAGIENQDLQDSFNGALRGGIVSTIQGGDARQGAAMGGLNGLFSYGNSLARNSMFGDEIPDVGTIGGNMYDDSGESSATLGGYATPAQYEANLQAMGGNDRLAPTVRATSASGGLADQVLSLVGNFKIPDLKYGDIAQGLAGMYMGQRQRRMARDMRRQIAGNRGAYESQLRNNLQRKDAAAGRRSDYAGRETQLQASLAELDSRNMPAMNQLSAMETSGLGSMLNAGLVTGNRLGWWGQQPSLQTMPNYSTQLPSLSTLGSQPQSYSLMDDQNRNKYRLGGG